jgi:hypothetical protein
MSDVNLTRRTNVLNESCRYQRKPNYFKFAYPEMTISPQERSVLLSELQRLGWDANKVRQLQTKVKTVFARMREAVGRYIPDLVFQINLNQNYNYNQLVTVDLEEKKFTLDLSKLNCETVLAKLPRAFAEAVIDYFLYQSGKHNILDNPTAILKGVANPFLESLRLEVAEVRTRYNVFAMEPCGEAELTFTQKGLSEYVHYNLGLGATNIVRAKLAKIIFPRLTHPRGETEIPLKTFISTVNTRLNHPQLDGRNNLREVCLELGGLAALAEARGFRDLAALAEKQLKKLIIPAEASNQYIEDLTSVRMDEGAAGRPIHRQVLPAIALAEKGVSITLQAVGLFRAAKTAYMDLFAQVKFLAGRQN